MDEITGQVRPILDSLINTFMRRNFRAKYFLIFCIILWVEILIAVFVKDRFVRPFVGDVLVVLLLYALVRALFEIRNHKMLAVCVLVFAYAVEFGQYFELVSRLGFAESKLATVVIGTTFAWEDILAYTIGFGLILMGDHTHWIDLNSV